MKRTGKSILSALLIAAFVLALLPIFELTSQAKLSPTGTLGLTLGSATYSGGSYYYNSALVTESTDGAGIKTILVSFSGTVGDTDEIILPALPTGFTLSTSSSTNPYSKRLSLADSVTATEVQDYIQSIGFRISNAAQSVNITVTTDSVAYDTFYNAATGHYYQYIPDTTTGWTDAYDNAKALHYMGRTGYLATVTTVEEDSFINTLAAGKTGWLGGTILQNTGGTDALYYDGFDTSQVVSSGWYWACGPEKGTTFYNVNSLYPSADQTYASGTDANNSTTYYNWARGSISYEPNNKTASVDTANADYESCLSTLNVAGNKGKSGTAFSWNDKRYDAAGSGEWDANGYFVEYGDLTTGDNGAGSAAYSSASGTPADQTEIVLDNVIWTSSDTYTCDLTLPVSAAMVTISVDSGSFSVPSLGTALNFLGGTSGANYLDSYDANARYDSAVFSFTSVSEAEALLSEILYTPDGTTKQTITATSSAVAPTGQDLYFGGHFYRYVSSSYAWPQAVLAAGGTPDPYFGGRGYLATVTSQAENTILLKLVDTGAATGDHYNHAWLGGLWQRNTGTYNAPSITRGTDGHEISYADILNALNSGGPPSVFLLLPRYTDSFPVTKNIGDDSDNVRYYWIDGPEAGEEIENNTADFAPWHSFEPNTGDFTYIGWEGAYWDDAAGLGSTMGYIVEFSAFDGGSTTGVIKTATKSVSVPEIGPAVVTDTSVPVFVDGTAYPIGRLSTQISPDTGLMMTVVTPENDALKARLETASKSVLIPIPTQSGTAAQGAVVTGKVLDMAAQKHIPITVQADGIRYILRSGAIPTAALAGTLGVSDDKLDSLSLSLSISNCTSTELGLVQNADTAGSWSLLLPPTAFTVTASCNGKTAAVPLFDRYVARIVPIPTGVDPAKVTTALVVTETGATRHVPTDVYRDADGLWYARISSVTNSVYALVSNDAGFKDAAGKWYEAAVTEMAERMILNGRSSDLFDGGSSITRAEFAAVIVRALGLPETGVSSFSDLSAADWYFGAVGTAYTYKIVSGRGDGRFDPNAAITREEAMAMIARAARVAEFDGQAASGTAGFTDLGKVSAWALASAEFNLANGLIKGADGLIRPADNITRAEAATVVLRLLQKADLIDIRTQT